MGGEPIVPRGTARGRLESPVDRAPPTGILAGSPPSRRTIGRTTTTGAKKAAAIFCIALERAQKGSFPYETPTWLRDVLRAFAQDVAPTAPKHFLAYHLPWNEGQTSPFTPDEDGNLPPILYPFVEPPERAIFDIALTPELAIRLVQWRVELIERRTEKWLEEDERAIARLMAADEEDEPVEDERSRLPEPPEGAPSAQPQRVDPRAPASRARPHPGRGPSVAAGARGNKLVGRRGTATAW